MKTQDELDNENAIRILKTYIDLEDDDLDIIQNIDVRPLDIVEAMKEFKYFENK